MCSLPSSLTRFELYNFATLSWPLTISTLTELTSAPLFVTSIVFLALSMQDFTDPLFTFSQFPHLRSLSLLSGSFPSVQHLAFSSLSSLETLFFEEGSFPQVETVTITDDALPVLKEMDLRVLTSLTNVTVGENAMMLLEEFWVTDLDYFEVGERSMMGAR